MKYNLVRDSVDSRDFKFKLTQAQAIPASVDLRAGMPSVYDQGQLGSCSGNAVAAAFQYDQIKQNIPVWNPSRLFIYYNERLMEGTVNQDAGAELRDGIKSIATYGVCKEATWPYDVSQFAVKPITEAYTEAKQNLALQYERVNQDLVDLKTVLASGYPIVVGIMLFEAFESDQVAEIGIVPMPSPQDQCIGGHAVVICGYNDATSRFLMRNSWGPSWGDQGYFYLPYEYLTNDQLALDFWVVTSIN